MLYVGLYGQIIRHQLQSNLEVLPKIYTLIVSIGKTDFSKISAQYLTDLVQKSSDNVVENGSDSSSPIILAHQILSRIEKITEEAAFAALGADAPAEQLLALLREKTSPGIDPNHSRQNS